MERRRRKKEEGDGMHRQRGNERNKGGGRGKREGAI